ncbi:TPM domain-containing protein [Nocardia sp. CNY236]|uniref:TPM domain-containing protein n=1 Tax=Nocardia sp. CNY236 TaxID=1169152 RepID=UPI0004212876|nr:TPM domain-containing protein [Nocardia sp. CNY236]
MSLLLWNRLARLLVLGVTLSGLLVGAASSGAEPPSRMDTHVEDSARALADDQLRQVRTAVDRLYADQRIRLWVTYVRDFDGIAPQDWAARTAALSGFGERDLLLAVATEDRAYRLAGTVPSGISDSELDDIEIDAIEPALRDGRWAEAAIAAADGMDSALRNGGVSTRALLLIGLAVVLTTGGLVWFGRKRRGDRFEAALTAARGIDPQDTAALAALPLDTLHARSREALVDIDNAVRTSGEELDLASGEFGETATAPFRTALEHAKAAAAKAFTIRQRLDDAIPETPEQQRALLVELIGTVGAADKELDAQVAEFDAMRDLLFDAAARLDALTRDSVDVIARFPGSDAEIVRLRAAYPASVLAPIDDNVTMARERIAFAEKNIDSGRAALRRRVGRQGGAVAAIRAAESAIGQARILLDAVDNASTDIHQARDGLAGVLEELRRDIATATEFTAYGGPDLEAARTAAQSALAEATSTAATDPLTAFHHAVTADTDLDRALADATDRKRAVEDLQRRLDRALANARARIGAALDYITPRRGGVDAEARTRLSEAQRNLDQANQLSSTEPGQALQYAQTAAVLGERALHIAQSSVLAWESRTPYRGTDTAAVLGGILVGGLLRGVAGGARHSGTGLRAGSFGGSTGTRRINRGGRF